MKYLSLVLLLISAACYAQIPEPALISIESLGGNKFDEVFKCHNYLSTDGFIVSISSNSTSGTMDFSCNNPVYGCTVFQKRNNKNEVVWEKCYTADTVRSACYLFEDKDGHRIIGGNRYNGVQRDLKIWKEDFNGSILWEKRYGGTGGEILRVMTPTNDDGYLMLCETNSDDGDVGLHNGGGLSNDIWIIKVDSNGNKAWSNVIGGTDDEYVSAVALGLNNDIYITGGTYSNDLDATGNHDITGNTLDCYVMHLDENGNILWHRDLGGKNSDGGSGCYPDGTGGIYLIAESSSTDGDVQSHIGGIDFWLLHLNSLGNIVWEKSYGGLFDERPASMCVATDGTLWIGGYAEKISGQVQKNYGSLDGWIVHTDNQGNLLNAKTLGAFKEDKAQVLFPLPGNLVLVGGHYFAPGPVGGEFATSYQGQDDIFFAILAPWPTNILNLNTETRLEQLAPNPATDRVSLSIKNQTEISSIIITDVLGNKQYTNKQQGQTLSIDVHSWARGIYLVQLTDEAGRISYERLVLE